MKEKVIVVKEEVRDLVQRAWLEYYQKAEIIKGLFEDHKFDQDAAILKSQMFQRYEEECAKSRFAYETASEAMAREYAPEEWRNKDYTWSLDFATCELTFKLA